MSSAIVDRTGLRGDRLLMTTDRDGRFLSQRKIPALARLGCDLVPHAIILSFDGEYKRIPLPSSLDVRRPVEVWNDCFEALDAGDEAADWLESKFGQGMRLAVYDKFSPRNRNANDVPFTTSFSDGYPILITNSASLDSLNQDIGELFPMNRFRPNIVVEGLPPWLENDALEVRINGRKSSLLKPCLRCNVTRIDQKSGELGTMEPLQTLIKLGNGSAIFGSNVVLDEGLQVSVGQTLEWLLP